MNNYLIAPNSDIYLLKCPLEIDSLNQLDFTNISSQQTYFMSLPKVLMDDATYVRKEGRLYFEGSYDDYIGYNYCMYRNTNYSNKWFYAFISDMRYESNNSFSVDIQTDAFQTWMFDITINKSFIERTHVSTASDTAGAYIYPEGLETGDYVCNSISSIDLGERWYVIGCTKSYTASWGTGGGLYNGIFSGKTYYATSTGSNVSALINRYDNNGYGDDVAEIFVVPKNLINGLLDELNYDAELGVYRLLADYSQPQVGSATVTRPTTIDGYTPKNKKLLIYPYQYILADNNAGNSVVYQYELFSTPSACVFKVIGVLTPGTSMTMVPVAYTNSTGNASNNQGNLVAPNMMMNSLTLGKYPICNWTTDVYTNWLTQNSVNMQYNVLQSTVTGAASGATTGASLGTLLAPGIGTAAGAVVGGTIGGMTSNYGAIWENDREKYEHQFFPSESKGNANAGDVITSFGANKPSIYKMSIKSEMAKVIDDYFDMFGYKVNRILNVNTKSRSNWNYIKTIDVNIIGDIPQADLQKIKSLYNNGFTIWHKPANFLDYTQTNS